MLQSSIYFYNATWEDLLISLSFSLKAFNWNNLRGSECYAVGLIKNVAVDGITTLGLLA